MTTYCVYALLGIITRKMSNLIASSTLNVKKNQVLEDSLSVPLCLWTEGQNPEKKMHFQMQLSNVDNLM